MLDALQPAVALQQSMLSSEAATSSRRWAAAEPVWTCTSCPLPLLAGVFFPMILLRPIEPPVTGATPNAAGAQHGVQAAHFPGWLLLTSTCSLTCLVYLFSD